MSIPFTQANLHLSDEQGFLLYETMAQLDYHFDNPVNPELHLDPFHSVSQPELEGTTCIYHPRVVLSQQGGLIKSRKIGVPPVGGGRRGVCGPMSRQSRKRLLDRMQSIDHEKSSPAGVLFFDVTYATLPPEPQDMKKHLRAFLAFLDRTYDNPGNVWTLELGDKNGRPHFHFLLYAYTINPMIAKQVITAGWVKASKGYGGFGNYSDAREPKAVWKYLAPYIAKGVKSAKSNRAGDQATLDGAPVPARYVRDLTEAHIVTKTMWYGRPWGMRNREKFTFAQITELALEATAVNHRDIRHLDNTLTQFLRIARRWVKANRRTDAKSLGNKLFFMNAKKLKQTLKESPRAQLLYSRISTITKDWEQRIAWRFLGKAHTRFLNPKDDWNRFTLYTPDSFDFFTTMEWISTNLAVNNSERGRREAKPPGQPWQFDSETDSKLLDGGEGVKPPYKARQGVHAVAHT